MSDETNNGAGNGSGNDDGPDTDARFTKRHGRHSRALYSIDANDVLSLRAAASVISDKLLPEILKHADCGEGGGRCAIYDPGMVAGLMEMSSRLRAVAGAWDDIQESDKNGIGGDDSVFVEIDDDDIPDFVKQAVADFAADIGGSGTTVRVARMQGGPSRRGMGNFMGKRRGKENKGGFDA